MKRLSLLLLVLLTFPQTSHAGDHAMEREEFYRKRNVKNLRSASTWILENGIDVYVRGGQREIGRRLIHEFSCQLRTEPTVGDPRHLAKFTVGAAGSQHDVLCLTRVSNGEIYEYWRILKTSLEWSKMPEGLEFVVTRADRVDGVREIVHRSERFFRSYKVSDQVTVALDLDNLELLYDLHAWLFPESFPNSDLKDWMIHIDEKGNYVRVPMRGQADGVRPEWR